MSVVSGGLTLATLLWRSVKQVICSGPTSLTTPCHIMKEPVFDIVPWAGTDFKCVVDRRSL